MRGVPRGAARHRSSTGRDTSTGNHETGGQRGRVCPLAHTSIHAPLPHLRRVHLSCGRNRLTLRAADRRLDRRRDSTRCAVPAPPPTVPRLVWLERPPCRGARRLDARRPARVRERTRVPRSDRPSRSSRAPARVPPHPRPPTPSRWPGHHSLVRRRPRVGHTVVRFGRVSARPSHAMLTAATPRRRTAPPPTATLAGAARPRCRAARGRLVTQNLSRGRCGSSRRAARP